MKKGAELTQKEAIKGSIDKWRKIVDYLKTRQRRSETLIKTLLHLEQGIGNCPLCHKYYERGGVDTICEGCPVVAATKNGSVGCVGTPYVKWHNIIYRKGTHAELLATAEDELEFLKKLEK